MFSIDNDKTTREMSDMVLLRVISIETTWVEWRRDGSRNLLDNGWANPVVLQEILHEKENFSYIDFCNKCTTLHWITVALGMCLLNIYCDVLNIINT